jgi:hypothetical protein
LLESHSLPLTNEELAKLDVLAHSHQDDESAISEENTLTIKIFKKKFHQN